MILNPVKEIRLRHRGTLESFSEDCGVHLQALYLTEQGVYPHILPNIVEHLVSLGEDAQRLDNVYRSYQAEKRRYVGAFLLLSEYVTKEPIYELGHPFVVFREGLNGPDGPLSRMSFCKKFCVQPSLMHRLETSVAKHLPEQLRVALTEAGLPANVIAELDNRCEEYWDGGFAQAV